MSASRSACIIVLVSVRLPLSVTAIPAMAVPFGDFTAFSKFVRLACMLAAVSLTLSLVSVKLELVVTCVCNVAISAAATPVASMLAPDENCVAKAWLLALICASLSVKALLSLTVIAVKRPAVAAVSSKVMLLTRLAEVSPMATCADFDKEPEAASTLSAAPAVVSASAAATPVIVRS